MTKRQIMDKLVAKGKMERGVIEGLQGSWGSGLAIMLISGRPVPCDNGATVRALEGAFGDVIQAGHVFNAGAVVGKEIYYSMDEMGLVLEGFTPVEDDSLDEEVDKRTARALLNS